MAEDDATLPTPPDSEETRLAPKELGDSWDDTPSRIGPYRLVQRIGQGGMGQVWKAEQSKPIKRTVALKLVKLGMDTEEFLVRFEAERQALALMEHPCVARVHDGGATETGRPYFVMEYVEGVPITDHCDQQRLTVEERLRLFIQVCEGVQHAHQKGIIHRDLKPSNVLVTEVDGAPFPKIIDFGVAKATTQSLTDKTFHTVLGGWIGTPAYMSPEQAEITADIDTRSDVYSLGVMLYEILTGLRPFADETLGAGGFDDMRRVIREVEPPRPSTRLSQDGNVVTAAQDRSIDPRALSRLLGGDLDWIVMKAIDKDKERRYGSVREFAEDVERALTDRPVTAGPPSRIYRARKFLRRHRLATAAATAVGLLLIVAVAGTSLGFLRARDEAERANRAAERARIEAATALRVSDFITDLFSASHPTEAEGQELTARDLLDLGRQRLEAELEEDPQVKARLLMTIGTSYTGLGSWQTGRELMEQALLLQPPTDSSDPVLRAQILSNLAMLLNQQDDYEAALAPAEEAVALYEAAANQPQDFSRSLGVLASAQAGTGSLDDAQHSARRALEVVEQFDGDTTVPENQRILPRDHVSARQASATVLFRAGDDAGAKAELEAALAKVPNGEIPTTRLSILNSLGAVEFRQGNVERGAELFEESLELTVELHGENSRRFERTLSNLAAARHVQGRLDEAEMLYLHVIEVREQSYGPEHPSLAQTLGNLAELYRDRGEPERAEPLYRRTLAIKETASGRSASTAYTLHQFGLNQERLGQLDEARQLLRRSVGISKEVFADAEHPLLLKRREDLERVVSARAGV